MIWTKKQRRLSAWRIAFFMVIVFLFFMSIDVCSGEWTTKTLTSNEKINENPAIATVDRMVHVVWSEQVDNNISVIAYRRSLDNGDTWSDTIYLSSNTTNAVYPTIAVSGNTVHVAWSDYRNVNPEVYYVQSTDNGMTWDTPQRLTYDDPRLLNIYDVNMVSEETKVYLAWKDYRSGSSEIFFKRSSDSGKTWGPDQRLTYDYRASYSPSIAVEGSAIYIAYDDYGSKTNVCVLASNDGGETWSLQYVTMNETSARYLKPSIGVSQNVVYLVWEDEPLGHPEIYFTKSVDGGKSYGAGRALTTSSAGSTNPKIYAYDESLTVIYQHAHGNSFDIYFVSSNDSGGSWSDSQLLLTGADYYTAKIAGYKNNIHIVCQEINESGLTNILYCVNTSGNSELVNSGSDIPISSTPGFEFVFFIIGIIIVFFAKGGYYNKKKQW